MADSTDSIADSPVELTDTIADSTDSMADTTDSITVSSDSMADSTDSFADLIADSTDSCRHIAALPPAQHVRPCNRTRCRVARHVECVGRQLGQRRGCARAPPR